MRNDQKPAAANKNQQEEQMILLGQGGLDNEWAQIEANTNALAAAVQANTPAAPSSGGPANPERSR